MKFAELTTAQKGKIGEELVDEWLREQGVIPYHAVFDGPHPFDRLVVTRSKRLFLIEVKTKPCREAYRDTGIDICDHQVYVEVARRYRLQTYLVFVDEKLKLIYGNSLKELSKPRAHQQGCGRLQYPYVLQASQIILWPVQAMLYWRTITDTDCQRLGALRRTGWVQNLDEDIDINTAIQ